MKHRTTLPDFRGDPIRKGDRVLAIGYGDGVPLWLCTTPGTVVAIGRKRIAVRFDGCVYGPNDRPHSAPSKHFRRLEA